jgi:adenylate cyclase class 2
VDEPYEVEVKFPLINKKAMRQTIIEAGGVALNSEYQEDIYYDHPCRFFSDTDESIRVRYRTRTEGPTITESGHAPVELTYKGPKIDKMTKTRIEYTVNLDKTDLDSMNQILLNTGFKYVAKIVKNREFFNIRGITASLDTVADVGDYIEFELIAYGKDKMETARERILKIASTFGLDEKDTVRESYLEIYQICNS